MSSWSEKNCAGYARLYIEARYMLETDTSNLEYQKRSKRIVGLVAWDLLSYDKVGQNESVFTILDNLADLRRSVAEKKLQRSP